MFTQTPDTSWYMIVGYIVFITLPTLFIVSMIWRQRNLKKDEEMISSLLRDERK
ncbi:hypothetical protein HY772_08610 [Candidatus Woesearchaeota archaeon]|nr:hypothetical protein [Candidatus Woesearchaeota archaeon]